MFSGDDVADDGVNFVMLQRSERTAAVFVHFDYVINYQRVRCWHERVRSVGWLAGCLFVLICANFFCFTFCPAHIVMTNRILLLNSGTSYSIITSADHQEIHAR